jgi:hypothetical protein
VRSFQVSELDHHRARGIGAYVHDLDPCFHLVYSCHRHRTSAPQNELYAPILTRTLQIEALSRIVESVGSVLSSSALLLSMLSCNLKSIAKKSS